MRAIVPVAHKRPSPNDAGVAMSADAWKYRPGPFGTLVDVSTAVSDVTLDAPLVERCAPPAAAELAQPLPLAPKLPHGHAFPDPSPRQNTTCGTGALPHDRWLPAGPVIVTWKLP